MHDGDLGIVHLVVGVTVVTTVVHQSGLPGFQAGKELRIGLGDHEQQAEYGRSDASNG